MRAQRGRAWQVGRMLAIGLGSGLAAAGLLTAGGLRVRPLFCVGVALTLTLVAGLVRLSWAPPSGVGVSGGLPPEEKRPYPDLYFLESRLSGASAERARYERRLRPLFVRLITERLRQEHGVDPVSAPDKARDIVGEDLWQLMTGAPAPTDPAPTDPAPANTAPSRHQMEAIITRIEGL